MHCAVMNWYNLYNESGIELAMIVVVTIDIATVVVTSVITKSIW